MEGTSIAANRAIIASDPSATLSYVEHSGAAITASQKSMAMLEERMAALGADLIIRKSVDRQTATARLLDSSESVSMLQIFVNNLEETLEKAYELAGEWLKIKSVDVEIEIGDNLRSSPDSPNFGDILAKMIIENKGMTVEQAVFELKRRGLLSASYEIPGETPEQVAGEEISSSSNEDEGVIPSN